MFSLINMKREEFRDGILGVRLYKITFLGIPVFEAKFTSTNNQAVRLLTPDTKKQVRVVGFE